MSVNELFKYATQQVVTYLDKPKEERKALKQVKKEEKPLWLSHMFGTIPLALMLLLRRKRKK